MGRTSKLLLQQGCLQWCREWLFGVGSMWIRVVRFRSRSLGRPKAKVIGSSLVRYPLNFYGKHAGEFRRYMFYRDPSYS